MLYTGTDEIFFFKKYRSILLITCQLIGVLIGSHVFELLNTKAPKLPENLLFQNSDTSIPLRVADLLS